MVKKYILKKVDKVNPPINSGVSRFSINYKEELNNKQLEAVLSTEGFYLLIAGAGTGKTKTLVYRVARLIESGYSPSAILLLTFTRKAANEMMNRASAILDNRCSQIKGGTFHSFANIILRKNAAAVNLNSNFTILDQSDSEDIINLIRAELNFNKLKKRFPNKKTIFKITSLYVNTGKPIGELLENSFPHFLSFTEEIEKIFQLYKNYKEKNSLLDYDDLLIYFNKFLWELSPQSKEILKEIKFIMVDEYQDTNKLQAKIIEGLTQINKNLMVVGDDSQSIYSFRGANFKNIIDFPKTFCNTQIIKLEENYRSTQSILELTNNIIDAAIEKYPKKLFSKKNIGELPAIINATNENMQSKFIVDKILELHEEGISLNRIAVLFRSSYFSFDLEVELNKAGIPYQKIGGIKFIEAAHIKDTLSFLRIASNPKDVISWYRVLLLQEGVGQITAKKIVEQIIFAQETSAENTYQKALKISTNLKPNVKRLLSFMADLINKKESPSEKSEKIIDFYIPLLENKYDDYHKRKKDLETLQNIIHNYKNLNSLLSDMALEPTIDGVTGIEKDDNEDELLTLSTIHSAKGLEWHSVFVIHAMEGFFPSAKSAENIKVLEEERRLMYVACTRAKENLFLTYPMKIFDRQLGVTFSKPSRFISNLNENLIEEWILEE